MADVVEQQDEDPGDAVRQSDQCRAQDENAQQAQSPAQGQILQGAEVRVRVRGVGRDIDAEAASMSLGQGSRGGCHGLEDRAAAAWPGEHAQKGEAGEHDEGELGHRDHGTEHQTCRQAQSAPRNSQHDQNASRIMRPRTLRKTAVFRAVYRNVPRDENS